MKDFENSVFSGKVEEFAKYLTRSVVYREGQFTAKELDELATLKTLIKRVINIGEATNDLNEIKNMWERCKEN